MVRCAHNGFENGAPASADIDLCCRECMETCPLASGLRSEWGRRRGELMRCVTVAGFAAANVMLFSIALWAGRDGSMDAATRTLFSRLSALIALPALVYAIRPLVRSAFDALADRRINADLPVTLAVLLSAVLSLWEVMRAAPFVHADVAISLLFFLLLGRYCELHVRGRARARAERRLARIARPLTVIADGARHRLPAAQVDAGMVVMTAAGEEISVDGQVVDGSSDVDAGVITGESFPVAVAPGDVVFAGTFNLSAPLFVRAAKVGDQTLLSGIVRTMEAIERGRTHLAGVSGRLVGLYGPVALAVAAMTFAGWMVWGGASWQGALLIAISVLVSTCPCAATLAVPMAQAVMVERLTRQGILLRSVTAAERLARIDTVVFDKTSALTVGHPELIADPGRSEQDLRLAVSIAAASRHPVARAVVRAMPGVPPVAGVREVPGCGLAWGEVKLGSRRWLDLPEEPGQTQGAELFMVRPDARPVRFAFADPVRPDAAAVVAVLERSGYDLALLSGDRAPTVARVARELGIKRWLSDLGPGDKRVRLAELESLGRTVLMVGDGLNDTAILAGGCVSMSAAEAGDLVENVADVVFQGERLAPVAETLIVARRTDRVIRQNLTFALLSLVVAGGASVMGLVTPLLAVVILSASSGLTIANAFRLTVGRRQ